MKNWENNSSNGKYPIFQQISKFTKGKKISSKFFDISGKQHRSYFNLTKFFDEKNFKIHKRRKKISSKFVYILATQCRSSFNLTNFFDGKNFKIVISLGFQIFNNFVTWRLCQFRCCYFWHQ